VKTDYCHVDATTMWMVKNPEWFDVIVTDNLFGDIITDLGAMTQGGMGIAAGGNINPQGLSMFEPIGGSAPKYTGKNVINPMASICAAAMMLDALGEHKAAAAIEAAVAEVTPLMESQAAGKMGFSTTEIGNKVVAALKAATKPAAKKATVKAAAKPAAKKVATKAAAKPARKPCKRGGAKKT